MRTITIQGLDKPVSCLIKGSDYFREDVYDKAARNLDAYFAIGGNTIDTAYIYCGEKARRRSDAGWRSGATGNRSSS